MSVRFRRIVGLTDGTELRYAQAPRSSYAAATDTIVFLSHKTNDPTATKVATYINQVHHAIVYVAEWDDDVPHDQQGSLPRYLMDRIRECNGFLVNVNSTITMSMWIGYEIGGAHAFSKTRAKFMPTYVPRLPSVLDDLRRLSSYTALDSWIRSL